MARFEGTSLALSFEEDPYGPDNWVGVRVDGGHELAFRVAPGQVRRFQVAVGLEAKAHDLHVYRRSDPFTGTLTFHGMTLDPGASLREPPPALGRRIEFYGDSVTAGALAEAVGFEGQPDDQITLENEHDRLTNAYWSYAAITARRLGAEAHLNAIGGLALNDGHGWFGGEQLTGLETTWDKLDPIPGRNVPWDFTRFRPHVVVLAVGQNDARFKSIHDEPTRQAWKRDYHQLLDRMREKHPRAWFVLLLTVLGHDPKWDETVAQVAAERSDQVRYLRFRRAGTGTPGHPRLAEMQEMADELTPFLDGLPGVWDEAP